MRDGVWREAGAVVLLSCYEQGHQPLGLATPMALLTREGFRPKGVDLAAERLDRKLIENARFVGISVPMQTALMIGMVAARRIRRVNPGCHLCFYGLYAGLNERYLRDSVADSVLGGEYDRPLVDLVRDLEIGWTGGKEIGSRGTAPPVRGRGRYLLPDRKHLAPLDLYARLVDGKETHLAGQVETTRGCKHQCAHCPIPPVYSGKFFAVDRAVVLEDIRQVVSQGAGHISFADPDFLNGPGHAVRIVAAMHREFPELTFDFTAKVSHLLAHRNLLPFLRKSGCVFVVSAVESFSDEVLSNLAKGHSRADAFEALRVTREEGIPLRPSLLPFTPWSSLSDFKELLEIVKAEALVAEVDPVQYSMRLLLPPGSLLLSHPALHPHLTGMDQERFTHTWRHPEREMDRLWEEVAGLVASWAGREEPFDTYARIRRAAGLGDGEGETPTTTEPDQFRAGPRLTESWFC